MKLFRWKMYSLQIANGQEVYHNGKRIRLPSSYHSLSMGSNGIFVDGKRWKGDDDIQYVKVERNMELASGMLTVTDIDEVVVETGIPTIKLIAFVDKEENVVFESDEISLTKCNHTKNSKVIISIPHGFDRLYIGHCVDVDITGVSINHLEIHDLYGESEIGESKFQFVTLDGSSGSYTVANTESKEMECKTTSGDLYLHDCTIPKFKFSSVSGDLTVCNLNANHVQLETISGDCRVTDSNFASNYSINTTSGDTYVSNVEGEGSIQTVSGDVAVDNTKGLKYIDTVSGDISGRGTDKPRMRTVSGSKKYRII